MNYIPKTLLILFAAFCSFLTSYSQQKLKPGYIITLQGDTTKGFVEYHDWDMSPTEVLFATTQKSKTTKYGVADINGFGVNNIKYTKATVSVDSVSNQVESLTYVSEFQIKTYDAFLLTIFDGPKNLYYFKNGNQEVYLFINRNNNYELLRYKRFLKDLNGSPHIAENQGFLTQLAEYLNGCSDIKEKLYNTKYTLPDVSAAYKYYYACLKSYATYEKEQQKSHLKFNAIIGASLSRFGNTKPDYVYLNALNGKQSVNIAAGIGLDVFIPGSNQRWSINNEAIYSSFKGRSNSVEYFNEGRYNNYDATVSLSFIKINSMIRYWFHNAKVNYFLNAGMSNGLAIKSINKLITDEQFYTSRKQTEGLVIPTLRKHELGLLLGAGAQIDRFALQLRYEYGGSLATQETQLKVQKLYLLLTYAF